MWILGYCHFQEWVAVSYASGQPSGLFTCQFLKRCLSSRVVFVPYIRDGQSESCCLATQYLIKLVVNLIHATFCQKGSQFLVVAFGLFSVHCPWVAFVSLSTRPLFFFKSLSFKLVSRSQNSVERWRFIIFSSLQLSLQQKQTGSSTRLIQLVDFYLWFRGALLPETFWLILSRRGSF